ncbi:MAG: winged helix-turn-helix domain-containing protein [Pyrinomonadaceae bacterium]
MSFYEFADFRIDSEERVLYRDGTPVPLAPKVFDTLFCLVHRHGRVVSKDTLMEEIWQNTFVEENNLTQYIFTLRRVLGENKEGVKFIETVSRRGYRFLPNVIVAELEEEIWNSAVGRFPAARFVRSDLNRGPDKQSFENEYQNAHLISKGPSQIKRDEATHDLLPKAETHAITDVRRKSFIRPILFLGFFAAILVIASLGFGLRFGSTSHPEALYSRDVKLKRLTERGNIRGAAISSDGNSLLYVLLEGKFFSLRLKNISNESEVVIIPPTVEQFGQARFSPDGNFIYFVKREGLFQIPVFGGESRLIASNGWGGFSVSPDGRQVAFPRSKNPGESTSIVITQIDGSGERILPPRPEPEFYASFGHTPAWSSDGEHLTAIIGRRDSKEMRLVEVNLQSGSERELEMQDAWQDFHSMRWANHETLLISAQKIGEVNSQIWSVKFPGGIAKRITNDFDNYLGFSFSKDTDKIVGFQEVENVHLWLFDKETGAARQVTSGVNRSDGRFGLAFAPDNRIVYTARDKNNYDIFSANMNGGDIVRLTKNAGQQNIDVVVSPDNQFIAFVSDRSGQPRLWRMNLDGTDARRLTDLSDDREQVENSPYFSADGQWIYYVFLQHGKGSIRKIPSLGGESIATSQTIKGVSEPVLSPNGKLLAHGVYNDEAKSPLQVAVMSLENLSAKEKFFAFPAFRQRVRWTSDSESVVSIDFQTDVYNLWETNLASGERRQITNFTADEIYRFDVSTDGRFYVFSRGNYFHDAVLIER